MNPGLVVIFGRLGFLGLMLSTLNTYKLRLYKNTPYIPSVTDTQARLTESTFPGYAPIPLTSWGSVYANAIFQAETDELLRVFTCTGGAPVESVYGYYITDTVGNLIAVQPGLTAGVQMVNPGDSYAVVPKLVLGDLQP